ncbi:hypothetical protein [Streptomyces triticirhizae]|uniref:Integral membrane protein n=1 Tax=Streptomyces triticirhizae TaxID=2483353 RepID=A0A3M2MB55_9ACTN|nr:hypothetical protein [Streptomyces triticirhizae]RMI46742.1 hypothetical protein EBN88_00475 [Streptomyces triticirhizae]
MGISTLVRSVLAYDPGISPEEGGLPGLDVLVDVMGSINLYGIIAIVGAFALAATAWAYGHFGSSPGAEQTGKRGLLVATGSALLLGAANGIIAFFSALGERVE